MKKFEEYSQSQQDALMAAYQLIRNGQEMDMRECFGAYRVICQYINDNPPIEQSNGLS